MSLEHSKNKTYIRILRIIELLTVFPLGIIILLFICPKEIPSYIKDGLRDWIQWFKVAQDFEYH